MDEQALRELLRTGETHRLELKECSRLRKGDVQHVLCAFANDFAEVGGGWLVIGVTDDKSVVGVPDADEFQRLVASHARECEPPVHVEVHVLSIEGRSVVVVTMQRSPARPHFASGACYVRVGSMTRPATSGEIEELFRRRHRSVPTEDEPVLSARPEDLDWDAFERFLRARPASAMRNGHSGQEVAQATGWLVQGPQGQVHPTVSALLLFGHEPQRFLPQNGIDFARFMGEGRDADVTDRQTFEGQIGDCVQRCLQKVIDLSLRGYDFESMRPLRRNLEEYPLLVVREALANAIVHRDYARRTSKVTVWMFDDRIEVQSPGGLFGKVTRENFGRTTDYRNRRLAEAFYLSARLTEMIGRGVPFMYKTMESNGSAPPRFEFDPQFVQVVLPGQPVYLARRLYQQATALLSEHDPTGAVARLQKATALAGTIPELRVALGTAYRSQGLHSEAKTEFETAIKLDPGVAGAYIELAALQVEMGSVEAARTTLAVGVRHARERAEILRQASRLELREGALQKSFDLIESARTYAPEDWTLLSEYGSAAMRLGHYGEARDSLERACGLGDASVGVATLQALLDAQVHTEAEPEAVERTFRRLISMQPRQQSAYQAYFNYLSRKGLAEPALAVAQAASEQGFVISTEAAHRAERVFLGGLPPDTSVEELKAWLASQGLGTVMVTLKKNSKGYVYALLDYDAGDVAAAIRSLDGAMWQSRRLKANLDRQSPTGQRRSAPRQRSR